MISRRVGRGARRPGLAIRVVAGVTAFALLPGGTAFGAARGAPRTKVHRLKARTHVPAEEWPVTGQAAIVLAKAKAAVSPGEKPVPIASLAKVMTAYLTLKEHPLYGTDGFTVTVTAEDQQAEAADAAQAQSVMPVTAGEQLTERQLLEALLIPSANNVADMLADQLGGDESTFVAQMNKTARKLGMRHTTYTDPSGFDPGTVSTASDQLRIFEKAMHYPAFREIVSLAAVTLPVDGTVTNFNPLVNEGYEGKTGSDAAAAGCLAWYAHVTVNGRRRNVVGVVLGQGSGENTPTLLSAAGQAAEQLVHAVAPTATVVPPPTTVPPPTVPTTPPPTAPPTAPPPAPTPAPIAPAPTVPPPATQPAPTATAPPPTAPPPTPPPATAPPAPAPTAPPSTALPSVRTGQP